MISGTLGRPSAVRSPFHFEVMAFIWSGDGVIVCALENSPENRNNADPVNILYILIIGYQILIFELLGVFISILAWPGQNL
jgi:hypothetical protein